MKKGIGFPEYGHSNGGSEQNSSEYPLWSAGHWPSNSMSRPQKDDSRNFLPGQEGQRRRVLQLFANAEEKYGSINDLINKMTPEDAKKALQELHDELGINCGPPDPRYRNEHGAPQNREIVCISPEQDLKDELFNEYLDAIQRIKDSKKRAALAYYAINNLHPFLDGNGRTSRAVYLLVTQYYKPGYAPDREQHVSNPEQYVMHNPAIPRWAVGGDPYDGSMYMYVKQQLALVGEMNELANILMQEELIKEGKINDTLSGVATSGISFRVESKTPIVGKNDWNQLTPKEKMEKGHVDMWISEENRKVLSGTEQDNLLYAASDAEMSDDCSSISGLALAIVLDSKDTLQNYAKECLDRENNKLSFIVNHNDNRQDAENGLFRDWTPEDYRFFLRAYKQLKRKQNEIIMSIFTDNLCFCEGRNIADWVVGKYHSNQVVLPEERRCSLLSKYLKSR